jgi:CRP-like cAMP-binding protein
MTRKQRTLTAKRKYLAAAMLAQKIGYLKVQDFSHLSFFDSLSTQEFNAHKILRPHDELYLIRKGMVEIWHSYHDMLVSELGPNSIFGDMSLLGQTMLGCKAIAGSSGVTVAVIDIEKANDWIKQDGLNLFQKLGPKLRHLETDHYRVSFQTVESRLAALLLEMADATNSVKGFTHKSLGKQIGAYRETVTNAIHEMKVNGSIEVGRMRITILDKRALRELSEL